MLQRATCRYIGTALTSHRRRSALHPIAKAFHSAELEYVFGTLDVRQGATWKPEDRKLSEQMMGYWANFAKTGNPNGPDLPKWPRYDTDHAIIHLNAPITVGPDANRSKYQYLSTVETAQSRR
jgi:para-nitrobenzyl esterase